jgi:hypothetical protein
VPTGFALGEPPTYFDLKTTALYSPPCSLCINYGGIRYDDETNLRLFHYENEAWDDCTVSLDTLNNQICGCVQSLSMFSIFAGEGGAGVCDWPTPRSYSLSQNYPNPFNLGTTINYQLQKPGHVSLDIFDISGRIVVALEDCDKVAGNYQVVWNGKNKVGQIMSSGIYFYRLQVGGFVGRKSLLILK